MRRIFGNKMLQLVTTVLQCANRVLLEVSNSSQGCYLGWFLLEQNDFDWEIGTRDHTAPLIDYQALLHDSA